MIITSTGAMFVLIYLNTYAWEHLFFFETRVYMAMMMGASMAVIMLAYMLGMYANARLNLAIFIGAVVVFGLALGLGRSQVTVGGQSYMRAMIPHHSIAIMTSERARIRGARVEKLADEIIEAQRREITEMRFLIAALAEGDVVESIDQDPPARPGTVEDALANTLRSRLDLAPMTRADADRVLGVATGERCTFKRSRETDPIFWIDAVGEAAALKLNGVLVALVVRPERLVPKCSDKSAHQFKDLVVRKTCNGRFLPLHSHH
jgi:hypothetical protein